MNKNKINIDLAKERSSASSRNQMINPVSYGKRQNYSNQQIASHSELIDEQKYLYKQSKKQGLDHLYKESYQPAKYNRAVQYRNSKSYMKKMPSGHYVQYNLTKKQLDLLVDTEELKYFGVGFYLYIEFFRRILWLFFWMSIVIGISIYINWLGTGMSNYKPSFSTYLIKTTIGNYSQKKFTAYDGYIVTIAPATCFLMMFFFYLIWKKHFFTSILQVEENNSEVKPEKFCLQIQGLEESYLNESQLQRFFSSFGPVYEVSLVRRYKNKLSYFEQLDEIEEQLKQQELELILGGGDRQHIIYLKKQKQKLQQYISTLKIFPKTTSAFIHFQYEKSKVDCLTYFNDHFLFDTCSHSCARSCCCCCIRDPEQKYLFKGQKLYIKNEKVPEPEDINWQSFQINCCSKFFRIFFAFIIILIFLAISSTIIGLCSIYISQSAANCQNLTVAIPSTITQAQATTNQKALRCYCDANLFESFRDSAIKEVCKNYLTQIQISQGIQFAVIVVASLTNWIFGFINNKLINFIRPASKSQGLLLKTTIFTIFLVINTISLPIIIYGDIFGFKGANYVSLLTIISNDVRNIFKVDTLNFYDDFTQVWYRNVSVVFVNFIIFNTIIVWAFFIIDKYMSSNSSLQDDEGKILQKNMNQKITSYQFDVYKQTAGFYLIVIICMMFCGGIPALIPLGFINLWSRYITARSLLQYNSRRIQGIGQQFCSLSLGLMPFVLIICPLVSQWMLIGNSSIYPDKLPMKFPYFQGIIPILDKQLYLPFYLIISLVVFIEFFLYNTLIRCCSWFCNLCYERKEVTHPYHTRPFNQYAKGMNTLYSYNIRNNQEMKNVILNLQKYLVEKQMD